MIKYTRFLLLFTAKKVTTYLIPLIFALIFGGLLIAFIFTVKGHEAVIPKVSSQIYFLPFTFGPLYVGVKALNIFKEGEKDGTELMIVAKPITRIKIVIAKFVSLYIYVILFSVFIFLICIIIGYLDVNATTQEKFQFAGSLGVGSLIICMIMSSMIILVSSVFGNVATLISSILIPFLFSLTSGILSTVGGGVVTAEALSNDRRIETSPNGEAFVNKERYYNVSFGSMDRQFIWQQKGFYKTASYIDIYQQFIGFYSIFQTPAKVDGIPMVGRLEKNNLPTDFRKDKLVLDYKNKTYAFFPTINLGMWTSKFQDDIKHVNSSYVATWEAGMTKHFKTQTDSITLENVNDYFEDKIVHASILGSNNLHDLLDNIISSCQLDYLSNYLAVKYYNFVMNNQSLFTPTGISNAKQSYFSSWELQANNNSSSPLEMRSDVLVDVAKLPHYYLIKPWLNPTSVHLTWIFLGILLSGLIIFRYMKRDFK